MHLKWFGYIVRLQCFYFCVYIIRFDDQKKKKRRLPHADGTYQNDLSGQAVSVDTSEKSPLLGSGSKPTSYSSRTEQVDVEVRSGEREKKKKTPSLFLTLARVYGPTLLTAHLCKFVCDVLTFVGPILQG